MIVSEADFQRYLDEVLSAPAVTGDGVLGPDSVMWRVHREAALFLGAGRALLLQLAHPWVAAGIAEQSKVFADPLGRFHRTFGIVYTMVFGTRDQAIAVARRLYRRHAAVDGVMTETAGPFAAGSRYRANDVDALRWVHATLVETAMMSYGLLCPPLSADEREQYWRDAMRFAGLFGIPRDELPPDWASFKAYTAAMMESETLTVSAAARDIAQRIFSGEATSIGPPRWFTALTAEMLPERLRLAFALPYDERDRRSAARARIWLPRVYGLLPVRLRTVGPYQEAMARISGQACPPFTRLLNRAWIGQPLMPAAEAGGRRAPRPAH
ncbi:MULTISPECIES: oxygenase MpaB family protein [unclassified Bradyrhizobium]|uniref:oxygenase MpaB family protein n=1 Tax=unclassified Bradyrhizobium TaxID=2631580 RepID=UPI0028EF8303|nr:MULTISPECIES: oxygenase MpaB family protein [unclassified Bradyrhizobium]